MHKRANDRELWNLAYMTYMHTYPHAAPKAAASHADLVLRTRNEGEPEPEEERA